MAHTYLIWKEPGQQDRVLIWDTNTISIGRAPENDIVLDDDEISRKHAVLAKKGGGFEAQDYRTSNGTFVNGERFSLEKRVAAGDVIRVGKIELALRVGEEHPASLGLKVAYASSLKTVGMIPKGADAGATVLGLMDAAPPSDPFVVEPERASRHNAFIGGRVEGEVEFGIRDLDESLNEMELDLDEAPDLGDPVVPPATRPLPPAERGAPRAAATPAPAAAPKAGPAEDPAALLRKLKTLHEEGLIEDDEYKEKRAEILKRM